LTTKLRELAEAGRTTGRPRFGFRRTADGQTWEADPEQWPVVQRICFGLADAGNSIRLHEQLLAEGIDLRLAMVRQILRDPIYCDGVFERRYGGEVVGQQQLLLDDPIPVAVFECNQAILDARLSVP
jgi:hypothetical protein